MFPFVGVRKKKKSKLDTGNTKLRREFFPLRMTKTWDSWEGVTLSSNFPQGFVVLSPSFCKIAKHDNNMLTDE